MTPETSRALARAMNRLGLGTEIAAEILAEFADVESVSDLPPWVHDAAGVTSAERNADGPSRSRPDPYDLEAEATITRSQAMSSRQSATVLDRAKDPEKPYGDVSYADPGYQADGKKRYPIDTADHCQAAWSYINQAGNAEKYSPEELKRIKARIKSAMKKHGMMPADEEKSAADTAESRLRGGIFVRSFDFDYRDKSGDGRTLEGYAAVFNSPSRIRDLQGDFDEIILPGAFTRSLESRTPVLQWDHGKDPRIGTAPIGSIEDLREDDHGLYVRARLFDHPDIERVRLAIEGRAVKGMSFRFEVPSNGDTWTKRSGEPDLREIRDADVHELGPVVFPAYDTTSVSVRSLLAQLDPDEYRTLLRELAAMLRDADPPDLVAEQRARSAAGDGPGTPGNGAPPPPMHLRQRLDDGALRARGILT